MTDIHEDEKIVCDWCGTDDVRYTDTDRWACYACAEENHLNTNNPEINGFNRWCR